MSIGTDVLAVWLAAWRDYATDGVPASGAAEPDKATIRAVGSAVASGLDAVAASLASIGDGVVAGDARIVSTRAILDASLAYDAGTLGLVYADPTPANNGYYIKSGSAGSGSWPKITTMVLPAEIIDRVTALEAGMAALGALSALDLLPLDNIEPIDDQTILGRTGAGGGTGQVYALTPSEARGVLALGGLAVKDQAALSDIEDIAAGRVLGRTAGAGSGPPAEMTGDQLLALSGGASTGDLDAVSAALSALAGSLGALATRDTVGSAQIEAGAVSGSHVASASLPLSVLSSGVQAAITGAASAEDLGAVSAALSALSASLGALATRNTVGAAQIEAGAVGTAALAAGAVTGAAVLAGSLPLTVLESVAGACVLGRAFSADGPVRALTPAQGRTALDVLSRAEVGAVVVGAGGVTEAGDPLPPLYIMDRRTGYLLWWLDDAGRAHTARGGGSEVATLTDLAGVQGVASAVRLLSDTATDESGAPLPAFSVVDRRTGYLLLWQDAAGVMQTGGGAVGGGGGAATTGALLVDWATPNLRVLAPSPRKGSATAIEHTFERYAAGAQAGLWQWRSTYTIASLAYTAAREAALVALGQNDVVMSESSDAGGMSIDFPAETVASGGWIGGTAHGGEYPAPIGPRFSTAAPIIYIDGKEADLTASFRQSARSVRIITRTLLYRPRAPSLVPGVDAPVAEVVKDWSVDETGRLDISYQIKFVQQFTGEAYLPLICTQELFTRGYTDARVSVGGVAQDGAAFTIPGGIGDGAGQMAAYSLGPATEVRLEAETGESVDILLGEPRMWADGARPLGPTLMPGRAGFWCRTDGGYHKSYFPTGGQQITVGGQSYYRAAAGEIWARKISLVFTV